MQHLLEKLLHAIADWVFGGRFQEPGSRLKHEDLARIEAIERRSASRQSQARG